MQRIGKCYKCNKITYFTKARKALCKKCHAGAQRPLEGTYPKNNGNGNAPHYYSFRAKAMRRACIKKYKRCQLCGTTDNLTVHHIGGSTELGITCLCQTCHRAYEHWKAMQSAKEER